MGGKNHALQVGTVLKRIRVDLDDVIGRTIVGHSGGDVHRATVTVVVSVLVGDISIGAIDDVVDAVLGKVVSAGLLDAPQASQQHRQEFEVNKFVHKPSYFVVNNNLDRNDMANLIKNYHNSKILTLFLLIISNIEILLS